MVSRKNFFKFLAISFREGTPLRRVDILRKYQMVDPPESSMPWELYAATVEKELSDLLEDPEACEDKFQDFFERHPCCLPRLYPFCRRGAHGPFPYAVISQPVLPGISGHVPDFLYITRDSATVFAVLIEIERPFKKWATKGGQPSAAFTQATDQITDWKSWFSDPSNIRLFQESYQIPSDWVRFRSFEQRYFLVFGRRDDPTITPAFNRKRKQLERVNEFYMTYDRICPDREMEDCLCVKLDRDGYRAISVPPTFRLGPAWIEDLRMIRDVEVAIKNNQYLSKIRKDFLLQRLPYWKSVNCGELIRGGDCE